MPFIAKLTIGIIVAITALLIGYDIFVATNHVNNSLDTISGRMRIWAFTTPIVPWLWCGLAGHFFGPFNAGQFMSQKLSICLLVLLTWMVIWCGALLRSKGIVTPPWSVCVPAFLIWAILWAQ